MLLRIGDLRRGSSGQAGEVPKQFLEQSAITSDPAGGWSAFPDATQRFAQL